MEKGLALDVLRLIFLETYMDAFETDEKYKIYLQNEFKKYSEKLLPKVALTRNWREAQTVQTAEDSQPVKRPYLAT